MATYGWYLLEVSICMLLFYGFYLLMLRKCTFFYLNRLYLIFGVLASFVIPVLNIPIFENQSDIMLTAVINPALMEPEYDPFQTQNLSDYAPTVNYSMIFSAIYFAGVSFLFFKLLFSIKKIIRIRNNSTVYQIGNTKIVRTGSTLPFSFFNMVFLPQNEDDPMIFRHEMAHIKQYHWADLVVMELVSMLLWFNPFIFLYKRSLKLQHEYLADAEATKDESQIEVYLYSMLKHIQVVSCGVITTPFYCKTIKKRITMITKNKTSNKFLGIYLFMLPLVCFMLFAFSGSKALARDVVFPESDYTDNGFVQSDINEPSIYPVDAKKIKRISGFGARINPKTKKTHFHPGIDFAINEGERVVSTAAGVVVEAKYDSQNGYYAIVQHSDMYSTFYSHLKSLSIEEGEKMEVGQLIGYSGNTGRATGPHLHYEVYKNGKNVDPQDFLP